MTYLPISACSVAAPCSARQISVRGTPGANCTKTTLRRLVSGSCSDDAAHALDRQRVAQIGQIARLVGDALHHARFARRHFAQDRGPDRLALMRDRGDLHRHVEAFERDMAVAFAERTFRLEQFGIDQPLDDEFGVGRHVEIDGRGLDDADRRAGQPAGHRHLVAIDRQLLRSGEHHDRRGADHDGDRHRLFQLAVFLPVQITAGAAGPRRHAHAEPVGGFQAAAIGAHVADAGFRILGDAHGGGEIRAPSHSRASRSAPAKVSGRRPAGAAHRP